MIKGTASWNLRDFFWKHMSFLSIFCHILSHIILIYDSYMIHIWFIYESYVIDQEKYERVYWLTINANEFLKPVIWGSKMVPTVLLQILRLWVSQTFLSFFFHLPGRKNGRKPQTPLEHLSMKFHCLTRCKKPDFCDSHAKTKHSGAKLENEAWKRDESNM